MIFSENRYPLFGIMLWRVPSPSGRPRQRGGSAGRRICRAQRRHVVGQGDRHARDLFVQFRHVVNAAGGELVAPDLAPGQAHLVDAVRPDIGSAAAQGMRPLAEAFHVVRGRGGGEFAREGGRISVELGNELGDEIVAADRCRSFSFCGSTHELPPWNFGCAAMLATPSAAGRASAPVPSGTSWSIMASRRAGSTGLVRQPSMTAASHRARASLVASAVSATTGICSLPSEVKR